MSNRIESIRRKLETALSPDTLEIIDDSHQHIGHPSAQGGAGHYTVVLQAACLENLSRVAQHQKVYAALNDMIPDEIHALSIQVQTK